ncbi:MAG: alpha-hydroxy acid oxidase [Candidatus Nanopelagicales bacterium]
MAQGTLAGASGEMGRVDDEPTFGDGLPVGIGDFAVAAERVLPAEVWAYVDGGAGDEHTLRASTQAWQKIQLLPRVLVDVSRVDTSLRLLGSDLAHPILLAPTAAHAMYHSSAEVGALEGAAAAAALAVMSTLGTTPVAELGAAATGPWWLQLYVQADRDFTLDLIQRSVGHGATAVVLTVDTPLLGARDRDRRSGGHTVDGMQPPNLAPVVDSPVTDLPLHERVYNVHLDPSLTWDTLDWLVERSPVPVLVKGVVRGDDARLAVDHGAGGVIVSNHGARNLDTVVPTATALAGVVAKVDRAVPVLVDGGIRRGTDIAKALALGADGVLVGRPVVWGLAIGGAAGVQRVIDILRAELVMAMALLGAPTIADLTPDLLRQPRF